MTEGFNATAADYPRDRTVLDLFEAQVMRTPQAIAVVDGERETSYGALASAARRLGRHLIGLGVGAETVVGVCLDRSAGLIEGLLGVFAGGRRLPAARSGLSGGASRVHAGRRGGAGGADDAGPCRAPGRGGGDGGAGTRLVVLDDVATVAAIAAQPDGPIAESERHAALGPDSLAYVIYTSGSTGRPKGVAVRHGGVVNRLLWLRDQAGRGRAMCSCRRRR